MLQKIIKSVELQKPYQVGWVELDMDEWEWLIAHIEKLRREVDLAERAYLDGVVKTAERCAEIADEHSSCEGIAQSIRYQIMMEFDLPPAA